MARQKAINRAVAVSAALGAALLGLSACTSTVKGSASPADTASSSSGGGGSSASSDDSGGSSSSGSDNSGPSISTSDSGSGGSGSGADDAAQAPDEAFSYKNGVEVKLGTPTPQDYPNAGDVLSDEEGRAFPITITNPSNETIDMSSYRDETTVYCGDDYTSSEWVIDDAPETGTPTIAPGGSSNYTLGVAVKKSDLGGKCLVTVIFAVNGIDSSDIDPAKFVITVN